LHLPKLAFAACSKLTGVISNSALLAFAGSCYAFAASGSLEALIAITRDSNVTSELSEAQLVECLPTADYGCDSSGDCDGCQGGDPSKALAYALSEWDGLASAAVYPYGDLIDSDTAGSCIVSSGHCLSNRKRSVSK